MHYNTLLVDTNTCIRPMFCNWEKAKKLTLKKHAILAAETYLKLPFFREIKIDSQVWLNDAKPYWRNLIFPEYKENRPQHTSALRDYIGFFSERVNSFSVHTYEADDLIAGYVRKFGDTKKEKILILTIDGDLCQLISENTDFYCVKNYFPQFRNLKNFSVWFESEVQGIAKSKIAQLDLNNPLDVILYKELSGDSCDNIKLKNTTRLQRKKLVDLRNPNYDILTVDGFIDNLNLHKHSVHQWSKLEEEKIYVDFENQAGHLFTTINKTDWSMV